MSVLAFGSAIIVLVQLLGLLFGWACGLSSRHRLAIVCFGVSVLGIPANIALNVWLS